MAGEDREQLLAEAIRVLTAAARLTRPVLERAAATDAGDVYEWVETGRTEPADWAEFVTQALAGAAANVGGVETVLAGRPGSWEADGVRQLLTSTVGHDGEYLLEHRTEPVVVELYVDEVLVDVGGWKPYDDAQRELQRRYEVNDASDFDEETRDAVADAIGELEGRLEEQRLADWRAYGEALTEAVLAAAARRPGLMVPVDVRVDLDTLRPLAQLQEEASWGLTEQLLAEAIAATPVPGDGRPPLERLQPTDGTAAS